MTPRRTKSRKPVGGGGARHPNSLAQLTSAPPPTPEGNTRATIHRVHSPVLLEPGSEAMGVFEVICTVAPLRDENGDLPVQDRFAAEELARIFIRLRRCGVYLDEHGEFTKGGKVRPVAEYERRLVNIALGLQDALGLTARSRVRLGLDLAQMPDVATAMSNPDRAEGDRKLRELDLIEGEAEDAE